MNFLIGTLLVFNGFWIGLVVGLWINHRPSQEHIDGRGLHIIDPSGGESVKRLPRKDDGGV